MKKWKRIALSISLASSLVVPTIVSASTLPPIEQWKKQATKGNTSLAYKRFEEVQNQISENTLIVKYKEKIPASVHRSLGATVKQSFPQLGYDVVTIQEGKNIKEIMSNYAKLKAVKSVTPSFTYKQLSSSDPKTDRMYLLSLLRIDEAIKLSGNHSVTVAVIDKGIDTKHPELKGRTLPAYNAINPAGALIKDVHGTHVAGIIGANANNDVGAHGINPNVKILPIDVFGEGWGASDYTIAQGILYAIEKGAKVINMSLGGYFNSPILEEAVQKAIDAGITVVAAAGNEATDMYAVPASYEGVISVGATDSKNKLAEFSNYGPSVDIVAPGVDVYSSIYDYTKGPSFAELSGTSMASPVVAGVASLLLSKYPDLKPYQIEWILEQTATDLGEKGYDLKYGNGLVNPVAALQYDIKNVPQKEKWDDETIIAKAETIDAIERYVKKGSFTKPEEIHWVKVKLQKGESVQAVLEGANMYDYKLVFRFYPEGKTASEKPIQINDGRAGEAEGKLFTAKENGTLVIGVTDANGNYSLQGKSTYTLTVQSFSELLQDGLTKDNPATIDILPFSTEQLTFVPEADERESDRDYFRFTVEEPTMMKFQTTSVPGIDSSMGVYLAEELNGAIDTSEKYQETPYPIAYANNAGIGRGETLTFEAYPGTEYILEVSSEPFSAFYTMFFDYLSRSVKRDVQTSSIPYTLTAEKITFPADEDGLPAREQMTPPEEQQEELAHQEAFMNKQSGVTIIRDDWSYFEMEQVAQIVQQARPYKIRDKASGFIQFQDDVDFYRFTVPTTAAYEFTFQIPDEMIASAILFEYDEKKGDLFPVAYYFPYDWMTGKREANLSVILEKGKQYYLSVQNDYYQPVSNAYVITSRKLMDAPKDDYESNNKPIEATVIQPNDVKKGNFALMNDVDYYYYKHRQDNDTFTIFAKPSTINPSFPMELRGTLIPILSIVEDTNGNMSIDDDEYGKAITFYPNGWDPLYNVYASFKAKKNTGYFFIVEGRMKEGLSFQSYDFGIQTLNKKDEDQSSNIKNNIPSKPLELTKQGNEYKATGYMNIDVDYGDKDYYKFITEQEGIFSFKLDVPATMDGVIHIYDAKGRLVTTFDYYGNGDVELGTYSLDKGTYYIVIEDAFARPNANPYTLSIMKK